MHILDLFIYPIKSTIGQKIDESIVEKTGFKNDRSFAIIDLKNQVLTARENPKLLGIKASFKNSSIYVKFTDENSTHFNLKKSVKQKINAKIFDTSINCLTIDPRIDEWISEILNQKSRLIILDPEHERYIKSKYCGNERNPILFPDSSPIHLVSKKSLDDLNSRLKDHVDASVFRPNIFISGSIPYEEDNWKLIRIGNCEFEVLTKTKRCVFLNINPLTRDRNIDSEPLKTLSKYRKNDNQIHFGINLIPTKLGTIKKSDKIEIITTGN